MSGSTADTPAPRTFAGLPLSTLLVGAVALALLLWNAWLTVQVHRLQDREIVSVSLARIVGDFVQSEARAGGSPEQAALRTKVYIDATQAAMKGLARDGKVVLLSEAVAGNSVPDLTPAVKKAVDDKMKELANAR